MLHVTYDLFKILKVINVYLPCQNPLPLLLQRLKSYERLIELEPFFFRLVVIKDANCQMMLSNEFFCPYKENLFPPEIERKNGTPK